MYFFTAILKDTGLGIGIDKGLSNLVIMNNSFTVIGPPVVYACRFSNAKAGETLLNQSAYEDIFEKYFYSFWIDIQ